MPIAFTSTLTHKPMKIEKRPPKLTANPNPGTRNRHQQKMPTFSDKLWTSAALDLLDELLEEAAFVGTSSAKASTPSYVQKLWSNCTSKLK